jgi:transcriptional regulator with PAS, ATPase and Fis domain
MTTTIQLDTQEYSGIPGLVWIHDPQTGQSHELNRSAVHFGKDLDNDIVIQSNPHVSGTHARILKDAQERWLVEDLSSTNGTRVNHQVVVKAYLKPNDVLSLADYHFIFSPPTSEKSQTDIERLIAKLSILATHPSSVNLFNLAYHYAQTSEHICILGETGCGKEVLAHFIHHAKFKDQAAQKPYLPINMSALPESLMEYELFGAKKGAFTGAVADAPGIFENAGQGTVFLDEIGDLPLHLQPKLLRVLENREIRRIGESKNRKIHCNCIFATHQNLKSKVSEHTFREDLFHRICVLPLELTPLRERTEEILDLVRHFVEPPWTLSTSACQKLLGHPFPGNVRELKNVLTRAKILAGTQKRSGIQEEDILFF